MLLDYKLSNGCNIYAGMFCGCNKGTGKQISVKMKDCLKSLTCVIFLAMNLVQSHKHFIFRSNSKHLIVTSYIIIRDFTSIWLQLIWQAKLMISTATLFSKFESAFYSFLNHLVVGIYLEFSGILQEYKYTVDSVWKTLQGIDADPQA